MRVVLEIIAGPHRGQRLVLRIGDSVRIGRTEWADFALPQDDALSGVHCSLECLRDGCRVSDLESRNGTFVNGKQVAETVVQDGGQIAVGRTIFAVHVTGAEEPPSVVARQSPSEPSSQLPPSHLIPPQQAQAPASPMLSSSATVADSAARTIRLPEVAHVGDGMRVVLQAVAGPGSPQRVLLRAGETVIVGRTEWADLAFPRDLQMSDRHFELRCDQASCRIRDLGTAGGTLVNGNRVTEAILRDGDKVLAGQTRFVVRAEGTGAATAASEQRTTAGSFQAALDDPSPDVRREVLLAATWTRQPWLLDHCRNVCQQAPAENWDAVILLAILGRADDLPRILRIGRTADLGPRRFRALGAYGHPEAVHLLLPALDDEDAATAIAAACAFEKITGVQIPRDRPGQLPPADDEAETPETVLLPSAWKARDVWGGFKQQYSHCTRLCRGFDLSRETSPEVLNRLDMQSRWEATLRGRYEGVCGIRFADMGLIGSLRSL